MVRKELDNLIRLANTSDEDLRKMNFKDKQKVYKAKNRLCIRSWDSSKGTYIKNNKWNEIKKVEDKNDR